MADVTLLSVPRSGTHFLLYFFLVEMGLDVRFDHFVSSIGRRLPDILADPPHTIIVLEPKPANLVARGISDVVIDEVIAQYALHLPDLLAAGALEFDIDDPATIDPVLAALGIARTGPINAFLNAWPNIGPSHPGPQLDALNAALTDANRYWVGKPVLGDGIVEP